jgi:LysM repeat protein
MNYLRYALSLIFVGLGMFGLGQNMTVDQYVATYKGLAISEMQRTGVPASITLAQGILETEGGNSDLLKSSNNHFGIKCKSSWTGETVYHDDDARGECFRKYGCAADSYKDHSDFLKNSDRYSFLFQLDPQDYRGWAQGLRRAGYATNPKYAQILIQYIEQYHLNDYTMIALGKLKDTAQAGIAGVEVQAPVSTVSAEATTSTAAVQTAPPTTPPAVAAPKKPTYPQGEFHINETKVIFVPAGTSLLALADQYHISLAYLVDFNDLKDNNELPKDQLVYLQRKRKVGEKGVHVVESGESLYDIAQSEGIRLSALMEYNQLQEGTEPAAGTSLYLQAKTR